MRSPDKSARDVNAIIANIVHIDGVGKTHEAIVRELAAGLLVLKPLPPLGGYRADNTKYATALREWISEGEQLLAAPPEGFNPRQLFVPEFQ
jgi:hypothetical protein